MKTLKTLILCALAFILVFPESLAQKRKKTNQSDPTLSFSNNLYDGLEWRSIGPFRGGRSPQLPGFQGNLIYSILEQPEGAFGKQMMPEIVGKT